MMTEPENKQALDDVVAADYQEDNYEIRWWLILLLILLIFGGAIFVFKYLVSNEVEAKKSQLQEYTPSVEVVVAEIVDLTPELKLEGVVNPSKRTIILSEVAGAVVELSSQLQVGNMLEKDQLILRVNDADYLTQLATLASTLADAELLLSQEEARAAQSLRDWKKLGKGKPASALVKREPQIKSAQAKISSAKAAIEKAKRDVEKTVMRAPYRCIVEKKDVEEGAYVAIRSQIATIYSDSDFEVRLPVSLDQAAMLPSGNGVGSSVELEAIIGGKPYQWEGVVNRLEGGIDTKTFSMVMMVKVLPNAEQGMFEYPPKGMFVDAVMQCEPMKEVIKVPRLSRREGDVLWLLDENDQLNVVPFKKRFEQGGDLYISAELSAGDKVIVSPIALPVKGMKLKMDHAIDQDKNPSSSNN